MLKEEGFATRGKVALEGIEKFLKKTIIGGIIKKTIGNCVNWLTKFLSTLTCDNYFINKRMMLKNRVVRTFKEGLR